MQLNSEHRADLHELQPVDAGELCHIDGGMISPGTVAKVVVAVCTTVEWVKSKLSSAVVPS